MVGPILKESIIFIVFCHIFVSGKDILEVFRPNPSLPEELNEWLETVQKYKTDFRIIREVAAADKEKRNNDIQFYDYDDDAFNEEALDKFNVKANEDLEDPPKNDIYPYMYRNRQSHLPDSHSFREYNERYRSRNSPVRLRRDLNLIDKQNPVNAQSIGKVGEVKRSEIKYPDRYIQNKEVFSGQVVDFKNGLKQEEDNSKVDDNIKKRDIQIDVRSNGKLIKHITETGQNPRPILLNIQSQGSLDNAQNHLEKLTRSQQPNLDPLNPSVLYTLLNNNVKNSNVPNNNIKDKKKIHTSFDDIPSEREHSPIRSVKSEPQETNKKETLNNFNNLFSVNEHLNTDNSLARDAATKELVYRITFPQYGTLPDYSSSTSEPQNMDNRKSRKYQQNKHVNITTYNRNSLQDMSNFWTDSEKNRMRQGIEFARSNENFKKFPQPHIQPNMEQVKENETGFEPAQRIELDRDLDENIESTERTADAFNGPFGMPPNFHYRNKKNMYAMYTENNIPNFVDQPDQINRVLRPVEGKRQLVDNVDSVLSRYDMNGNEHDKDDPVANIIPMDNSEISDPDRFEKIHPLDMSTENIVMIDGDKPKDENFNSISYGNAVDVPDSLNVDESDAQMPFGDLDMKEIDIPLEPNNVVEFGLPNVDLEPTPINNINAGEFADVGVGKIETDRTGVDSGDAETHHEYKTPPHHHQVHKYITKTETITEVDDYPGDEENNKENNKETNRQLNEIELPPPPSGRNQHLNEQEKPHRHREIKIGAPPVRNDNHGRAPNPNKVVSIRDRPRGGPKNNKKYEDKTPRYPYNDRNNEIVDHRNEVKEPVNFNQFDRNAGKRRSNHNHIFAEIPPVNLILSRRSHFNGNHIRKYRGGNDRGNINSRLNHFDTLLLNRRGSENSYCREPKSRSDFIPAFIGRKLHSVEYAYDAYLEAPEEDSFDDLSTELQEDALERTAHAGLPHKDAVEGDYGDEEDSITEKNKKKNYTVTKKTENEFANPRTTTETDYDDDYVEDYDNQGTKSKDAVVAITKQIDKRKTTSVCNVTEHKQISQKNNEDNIDRNKDLSELKDTNINSFAHHLHKKYNPFQKITRKHVRSSIKNGNDVELKDKRDSKDNAKRNPKRNAPRKRHKRNKAKFTDANSDFQHWPSFVISDNENEETLKKRSLVMKKKYPTVTNNFPLASKDFFIGQQGQERTKSPKARSVENLEPKVETFNTSLHIEKRILADAEIPTVAPEAVIMMAVDGEDDAEHHKSTTPITTHTQEITTILPIIPESLGEICDEGDNKTLPQSYETLDDIINGALPERLISELFCKIRKDSRLKHRFNKGLKRTKPDSSFINTNETNTETKKLINAMSNIINKLQFTTTCQRLPHYLSTYLKTLTKVRRENVLDRMKQMDEIEFDEHQNDDTFIFQSVNRGGKDSLDQKVKILQDLLNKFNNLPDRCKSRAKPVKEYIENHLGLLSNMEYAVAKANKPTNKPINNLKRTADNSAWKEEDILVQEQLNSLGLGSQHNFKPKFNLDDLMHKKVSLNITATTKKLTTIRPKRGNVNKRDTQSVSTSQKYNKLLDAVRKVRLRREGERRLGEMYGKSKRHSNDYSEFHSDTKNTDAKYISRANFESPLVYSL